MTSRKCPRLVVFHPSPLSLELTYKTQLPGLFCWGLQHPFRPPYPFLHWVSLQCSASSDDSHRKLSTCHPPHFCSFSIPRSGQFLLLGIRTFLPYIWFLFSHLDFCSPNILLWIQPGNLHGERMMSDSSGSATIIQCSNKFCPPFISLEGICFYSVQPVTQAWV